MITKWALKLVNQLALCCAVIFLTLGGFSTSYADVVVFQQGTNGYTGTVDTNLISVFPNDDFSRSDSLNMATATGSLFIIRQGLLRFENIFGNGPNQIPLNATIQSATLTLTKLFVSNSPDGYGHRMLISWSDTDTWNSMGSGVQFDGTEAESAVDFTLSGSAPNYVAQTVDVTQTLKLWQTDPLTNFGWLLEGGPTTGFTLGFASSDYADASYRPILTVQFVANIPVLIDIKPGSDPNSINLSSAGVIPVAILSSNTFNAASVNPDTISLAGARVKMIGKSSKYLCHEEDVNSDGLIDLVCQVNTSEFMIEEGESVAVLEANTFEGAPIFGQDNIKIVPDN